MIKEKIQDLKKTTEQEVSHANSIDQLDQIRVQTLGKKGKLTDILKSIHTLPNKQKPEIGKLANEIKQNIYHLIEKKQKTLKKELLKSTLEREKIDITLPGKKPSIGHKHPLQKTTETIINFFTQKGFELEFGPQIETEFYNFDALNIPEEHPARDMHDTFYINKNHLLRTHTSPVQIHAMQEQAPPIRILAPGKVYRCDQDATHSPVFHQIEGLYVDKKVSFAQLKGILNNFLKTLFGNQKIRYRPSYFPFTEPSVEIDVLFKDANNNEKWLEIMGAGMVHPHVFEQVNYTQHHVTGFAFGLGIERIAMLIHNITDIRLFYENDQRFLNQF